METRFVCYNAGMIIVAPNLKKIKFFFDSG
ncbi:hypothetical protein FHS77_002928 [Paenochrobactrum gallinarii]|uniref:Uncharacterized protein n=1 Tax=Paenochrobactrum gallinarii TaxID=643673 RepID=A0A841LY97_9HYPH|nr:hypothetical protein [Paenochrobactrum gallinarii]